MKTGRLILIILSILLCLVLWGCGGDSSSGSESNGDLQGQNDFDYDSTPGDSAGFDGDGTETTEPTPPEAWEPTEEEPYLPVPDNCLLKLVAESVGGPVISKCVPDSETCTARFYFSEGGYLVFQLEEIDPDLISFSGYDSDDTFVFTMETVSNGDVFYNLFLDTEGNEYRLYESTDLREFTTVCPDGSEETVEIESDSHPAVEWLDIMMDEGFDCMLDLIAEEDFDECFE